MDVVSPLIPRGCLPRLPFSPWIRQVCVLPQPASMDDGLEVLTEDLTR